MFSHLPVYHHYTRYLRIHNHINTLFGYTNFFIITVIFLLIPGKIYSNNRYFNISDSSLNINVCEYINKDTLHHNTKLIKPRQIDLYNVINNTFHINLRRDDINKKELGPFFSAIPSFGYTLQSGLTWAITQSTSFYTDTSKNKISCVTGYIFYSQYNQIGSDINSNIFYYKYKIHIFGDWRFYKFPTNTYGLGNHTSLSNSLPIDYSFVRFYQYIYKEYFANLYFGIGYNLDDFWDITTKTDTGKIYKEFINKVKDSRAKSSGVSLNFLYDNRKNSLNAKTGTYFNIQYRTNFIFLGSDINWQSMLIDFRKYFCVPASTDNVLAFWSYNDLTLNRQPAYLNLPTIGLDDYNNTGRGYVQGRFTGNNLIYFETEYRFHISENGLFGGVVFGNVETLVKSINNEINTLIPGYGIGVRIKFNKHSDTNLAIDYGIGIGGSRGIFFNLGEVF